MTRSDVFERLAPEALPGLRILPIVHDRIDLAPWVGALLDHFQPVVVGVELPQAMTSAVERAIARLPSLSVVMVEQAARSASDEDSETDALIWVTTPGDPLAEALRWAQEHDRDRLFIDSDQGYAQRHSDAVPDPHALWSLGPDRYLELVVEAVAAGPAGEDDQLREATMAHRLRSRWSEIGATPERPIVALVGAAHVRRLAERLQAPTAEPFARPTPLDIDVRHLAPDSLSAVLAEVPVAHAVYERLRSGDLSPEPELEATVARKVSVERAGLRLVSRQEGPVDEDRRWRMVDRLAHRASVAIDSTGANEPPSSRRLDRWILGTELWKIAVGSYTQQTDETVAPWQERTFRDYAYRYSRVKGLLVPGLFEWTIAARGVADDNLAWELFDAARTYPWQQEHADDLPTVRIDGSMLDLGTRKVRFRQRFFRVKQRPLVVPISRRSDENPEDWLEGFAGGGLCSYPPEDIVIEDYCLFLKKKARGIVSAETARSEPFSTSMLDGLDLRETLRRVGDDRLWVRELGRDPGEVGSVVMIFDDDRASNPTTEGRSSQYPYLMTWLGEHEQECDMAFYATNPGEQVVGPGILRATYGGFLMSYPPGRLFDVWTDEDYLHAPDKPSVLIRAAVDYSRHKLVVHVGKEPPRDDHRRYAEGQSKRIVHIPLGALSPDSLRRVRVLHILTGRDKRAIAKRYVW